jgi:hypothetical protein
MKVKTELKIADEGEGDEKNFSTIFGQRCIICGKDIKIRGWYPEPTEFMKLYSYRQHLWDKHKIDAKIGDEVLILPRNMIGISIANLKRSWRVEETQIKKIKDKSM